MPTRNELKVGFDVVYNIACQTERNKTVRDSQIPGVVRKLISPDQAIVQWANGDVTQVRRSELNDAPRAISSFDEIEREIRDEQNLRNSRGVPPVGIKFDGDKPRVDLLTAGMPNALLEISKVLTYGAKKYDDHNWKIVPDGEKRYAAALMRHFLASQSGDTTDSETGISHLAHAACCLLFMLEKELLNAKPTK